MEWLPSVWHIMGSIPVKDSDFFFVSQLCHNQINTHFITKAENLLLIHLSPLTMSDSGGKDCCCVCSRLWFLSYILIFSLQEFSRGGRTVLRSAHTGTSPCDLLQGLVPLCVPTFKVRVFTSLSCHFCHSKWVVCLKKGYLRENGGHWNSRILLAIYVMLCWLLLITLNISILTLQFTIFIHWSLLTMTSIVLHNILHISSQLRLLQIFQDYFCKSLFFFSTVYSLRKHFLKKWK